MYVNHVFYCAHHLHSSYILTNIRLTKVVTPVWPPKGLRDRLVARGRKKLFTTAINQKLESLKSYVKSVFVKIGTKKFKIRKTASAIQGFNKQYTIDETSGI